MNVAVTLFAADMLTVQVPVPAQAPLQPAKVLPVSGVALSVTVVPLLKLAAQVLPQSTPAGVDATRPEPVPDLLTVRGKAVTAAVNVAVTLFAADMLTVQVPVPEQIPLQPAKVLPASDVAVRVTVVPLLKLAVQVLPQSIPAGLEATRPEPVPDLLTVKW